MVQRCTSEGKLLCVVLGGLLLQKLQDFNIEPVGTFLVSRSYVAGWPKKGKGATEEEE